MVNSNQENKTTVQDRLHEIDRFLGLHPAQAMPKDIPEGALFVIQLLREVKTLHQKCKPLLGSCEGYSFTLA